MLKKENKNFRKMFIVTEYAAALMSPAMSECFPRLDQNYAVRIKLSCSRTQHSASCEAQISNPSTGLFPAILGKGPWPKLVENDRLNIKIGRN